MWDPFGDLSSEQLEALDTFERLVIEANRRVNLVSRSSIDDFRVAHLQHSLALSIRAFPTGATVVDWGTGAGLPGIPLAIRFPAVRFVLIDSIGKKTDFVRAIVRKLGLANVDVVQARAESWTGSSDFAVSRATAPLVELWAWTREVLSDLRTTEDKRQWSPGLVALKGGDLLQEIDRLVKADPTVQVVTTSLAAFMDGPFDEKFVVEVGRG